VSPASHCASTIIAQHSLTLEHATFARARARADTWNRDKMNLTGSPFVPGPHPRHSLAPTSGPDAIYSGRYRCAACNFAGLVGSTHIGRRVTYDCIALRCAAAVVSHRAGVFECPITSRIKKIFNPGSESFDDAIIAQVAPCAANRSLATAAACFAAAQRVPGLSNATVSTRTAADPALPGGCTVAAAADSSTATVTFNALNFNKPAPPGAPAPACGNGAAEEVTGSASSLVRIGLEVSGSKDTVTITLAGPADVWFGVAFGATLMAEQPQAVIVDGVSGAVTERRLADHEAGALTPPTVTVVSSSASGGRRTVVLTRPLKGAGANDFTFDPASLRVEFLNAVGSGPTFAAHKAATAGNLALWPAQPAGGAGGAGGVACVCELPAAAFGQGSGFIKYLPTGEQAGFPPGRCAAAPRTEMLEMRNPTCDLRTYVGGLETCHHGWDLLDADQVRGRAVGTGGSGVGWFGWFGWWVVGQAACCCRAVRNPRNLRNTQLAAHNTRSTQHLQH
jgi:hypothetical protein